MSCCRDCKPKVKYGERQIELITLRGDAVIARKANAINALPEAAHKKTTAFLISVEGMRYFEPVAISCEDRERLRISAGVSLGKARQAARSGANRDLSERQAEAGHGPHGTVRKAAKELWNERLAEAERAGYVIAYKTGRLDAWREALVLGKGAAYCAIRVPLDRIKRSNVHVDHAEQEIIAQEAAKDAAVTAALCVLAGAEETGKCTPEDLARLRECTEYMESAMAVWRMGLGRLTGLVDRKDGHVEEYAYATGASLKSGDDFAELLIKLRYGDLSGTLRE